METEVKSAWIKAMQSGKYVKGQHNLRKNVTGVETHCALGVLADVVAPNLWETKAWLGKGLFIGEHDGNSSMLSDGMLNKVGLERIEARSISSVNDDSRSPSFDSVCKYVSENF